MSTETQAWICPYCFEDHRFEGLCKIEDLKAEIRKQNLKLDKAEKIHDMDLLICDSLRGVLATARIANNLKPHPLVTSALKAYDRNPLSGNDGEQVIKLKEERDRALGEVQDARNARDGNYAACLIWERENQKLTEENKKLKSAWDWVMNAVGGKALDKDSIFKEMELLELDFNGRQALGGGE